MGVSSLTPIDVWRLLVVLALALVALGLFWHVGMLRDSWRNRGRCFVKQSQMWKILWFWRWRSGQQLSQISRCYIPFIIVRVYAKFSFRVWRLCPAVLIGIATHLLHNGIDSKDENGILCLCETFWASSTGERLCISQESAWGDPSQHSLGVQFSVPTFQKSKMRCLRARRRQPLRVWMLRRWLLESVDI